MGEFIDRTGESYTHPKFGNLTIIKYTHARNCSVRFDDGTIVENVYYYDVKNNRVANPNYRNTLGVGYLGQGKYKGLKDKNNKIFYTVWNSMMNRCYNERDSKVLEGYRDCTISSEWQCFQVFAEWMENNYNPKTMQGWQLDKDILIKGNRVYSPHLCVFVPREINQIFLLNKKIRGEYPIGVYKRKDGKFIARSKNSKFLGSFATPEEAFQAYKIAKEAYIKEVADKWKDQITKQTYTAMYNYVVEITD